MATEKTESDKQQSSFFNARWFPAAASALALVIAIGGHSFTAVNTQGVSALKSEVNDLKGFREATNNVDGLQDRNLQAMKNELLRQRRAIQTLESQIAEQENASPSSASTYSTTGQRRAVPEERSAQIHQMQERSKQQFNNDQQDGPVIQQFTEALRAAIKANYAPPAWPHGAKVDEDDVVVLQITFARDGYIHNANVVIPSGMDYFDNAVLKAALTLDSFQQVARLDQADYLRVARFQVGISPAQML